MCVFGGKIERPKESVERIVVFSNMATDSGSENDIPMLENSVDDGGARMIFYKTKVVEFLGRSTPIVLQNDNGPCPLLAICKHLFLPLLLRFFILLNDDSILGYY